MSFDEAVKLMERLAPINTDKDLLAGMQWLSDEWDAYANGDQDDDFDCDSDWYDHWIYEVNAYNVVFKEMSKLFAEK